MTAKPRTATIISGGFLPLLAACSGGGGGTHATPATAVPVAAATQSISEKSASADGFVDSIGFNAHFGDTAGPYANNDAKVAQILLDLGVRHVRDGAFPVGLLRARSPVPPRKVSPRKASVLRTSPGVGYTGPDLSSWVACTSPAAEAIEGPNEYDLDASDRATAN